jgi:hypothetical protein
MSNYEEGFKSLDEKFGNGKDNVLALVTIARETKKEHLVQ